MSQGPNVANVAAPASPAVPRPRGASPPGRRRAPPRNRRGRRGMCVYRALERFTGRDDHISPNHPENAKA